MRRRPFEIQRARVLVCSTIAGVLCVIAVVVGGCAAKEKPFDRYGRTPEEVVRAFLAAVNAGDKDKARSFYWQESLEYVEGGDDYEHDAWNLIGQYSKFRNPEISANLGLGGCYRVDLREGGRTWDAILTLDLIDGEWRLNEGTKRKSSMPQPKPLPIDTNAVRMAAQAKYEGLLTDAKALEGKGKWKESLRSARKAAYSDWGDVTEARALLARVEKRADPHSGQNISLDLGPSAGTGEATRIKMDFVWIDSLKMWVGKYEVTNEEYRRYRGDHRTEGYRGHSLNEDRQPAVEVNYGEAVAYAEWANTTAKLPEGYMARLPNKSEWMAFAQCGDDRRYPWGSDDPPTYGNYADQMAKVSNSWEGSIAGYNDGYPVSCPVDDSGMNDWGLYGVGGNVWEWTSELHDETSGRRVLRGGSWRNGFRGNLACAHRRDDYLLDYCDAVGFRLVLARREDVLPLGSDHGK